MKEFVLGVCIIVVLFSSVMCFAATRTITLHWTCDIVDPNTPEIDSFKIYRKPTGFGYSLLATIPFTGVQDEYSYTYSQTFPDGEIDTYWYYVTVVSSEGIESVPSNEMSVTVDLSPPSPPMQLSPIVQ